MCELPSAYTQNHPTARKEHKCCECRGVIVRGEKYHKHSGIWDGMPSTFKVCEDCEKLRAYVDKGERDPEYLTPFLYLYESVFNRRDSEAIKRFMDIKRKRSGEISDWMIEREQSQSAALKVKGDGE